MSGPSHRQAGWPEAMLINQAFLKLMQSKGPGAEPDDRGVLEDAVVFAGGIEVPGPDQVRSARPWMAWKDANPARAMEESK